MTSSASETPREWAQAWFVGHGLPYFVDGIREGVTKRLSRARVALVAAVALTSGAVTAVATGLALDAWSGFTLGLVWAVLVVAGYAARALRVAMIAGWALRRTLGSMGLAVPLAMRALPMLLLFITFLFINTEVWQVASSLRGGVLWSTIVVFAAMAVLFLWTRLGEELDQADDLITPDDLLEHCAHTPLAPVAAEAATHEEFRERAQVRGLQHANLVLMLLVAQAVQVLLLSLAVFGFFLVFGAVAISPGVIELWTGQAPHGLLGVDWLSIELVRVATFLAGFSGLYFTVYAVNDATYRQQFFTAILRELGEVISMRVAYRHLRDHADSQPGPER